MTDDTKACPLCGETIKAVAVKCKHCKSSLIKSSPQSPTSDTPKYLCPHCGTQATDGMQKCRKCGKRLRKGHSRIRIIALASGGVLLLLAVISVAIQVSRVRQTRKPVEHDHGMGDVKGDVKGDVYGALNKMWAGALNAYEQGKAFPKGSEGFTPELCSGRTSQDDVARAFAQEPWISLSIVPPANRYLQYLFRSSGREKNAKFLAVVAFNPNCVGPTTYFSRFGSVNDDGEVFGLYQPKQSEEPPEW